MSDKRQIKNFDFVLLLLIVPLVIFGIMVIGSATQVNLGEDPYFVKNQILWFVIGLFLMLIVSFFDYHIFGELYLLGYFANLGLLVAVLLIGRNVNGATRWIYFGPVGIQPSEFAKIIMIICIAKILEKNKEKINNIFFLLFLGVFTLVPVLLIQKQPSLSSSLVLVAILIIMLFVAKISYKYVLGVLMVVIPSILLLFWYVQQPERPLLERFLKPYQINRIVAIIHPEQFADTVYYQTLKSINAIGSGQLYGKGLYQGTLNQLSYLPEPHNDFIFSVIAEEFGFIGCIGVIAMMFLIIVRCIWIAKDAKDLFGRLIITGVAGMFAFQTFVNIGVTTGILPNTGMPLPFLSYGGSSLWTNMIAIGLVLNIGMRRQTTFF